MTTVEWLINVWVVKGTLCAEDMVKAKEMEKEQSEDFFNAGVRYGSGSVMSTEWGEDTEEYNFEQYYNETYKSE